MPVVLPVWIMVKRQVFLVAGFLLFKLNLFRYLSINSSLFFVNPSLMANLNNTGGH